MSAPRTIKSRRVSAELRRYREQTGLNTIEAAKLLGISQGQVSRIELGTRGLKVPEVAAMLGLYKVPAHKRDELLNLVRQAGEPGWWSPTSAAALPQQWLALIDYERKATRILTYESLMVPGLLQTSDYARAVIAGAAETALSEDELDTKVAARLGRQGILSRSRPPRVDALLYEPLLRIPVGGPDVMCRQLRHLVELAERPSVLIRVIPTGVGAHPGMEGSFVIMELLDEPSLVHTETKTRSAFLEQEDLRVYRLAWERLSALALPVAESTELIGRTAAELASSLGRPA